MLVKAGDALEAAFQTWNNNRHWNFLRGTYTFPLVQPFDVLDCTVTSESTTVTAPSLSDVRAGDVVSGDGIRSETYVVSVDTTPVPDTMELSQPASAGATAVLTFARKDYNIPSNFKYIYNMRNVTTGRIVLPTDSRQFDRLNPQQLVLGEPMRYDPHPMGEVGKIRFLPTPDSRYMIEAKYYRRMTVPSSDGVALDIPIDFEWGMISEAKSIFLAEKGGYDQLALFWGDKANRAYLAAAKADVKQPDEGTRFLPSFMGEELAIGFGGGETATLQNAEGTGWGENWGDDWGQP